MLKIAVPSNGGEQISKELIGSNLFVIYETSRSEVRSRTERAQLHGIMSAVHDCDIVIGKDVPEAIRELLAIKGIRALNDYRNNADRAVQGFLNRKISRRRPGQRVLRNGVTA